jgi:hypothetical protein
MKAKRYDAGLKALAGFYGLLASDPDESTWEEYESLSRMASIASLELRGDWEEARMVRARDAMWSAANKAMQRGEIDLTFYANKACKEVMGGSY